MSIRPLKNINILFYGLTLILSLVSFSVLTNPTPNEAVKTVLLVDEYHPETRFSIRFLKVENIVFVAFSNYFNHSFLTFKNIQDLKDNTSFEFYSNKTICIETKKLQTKLYTSFNTKILYEDFIA
ncbi:MAG: hypothetical protein V7719_14665 [Psychroserpens sp.]|uniref:hypothetical protein n=1 Tax=Psychroserpens sp. TaxID=2020870 RepID=UPI003002A26B